MKGTIRKNKQAKIGFDGKPIKKLSPVSHQSQGIYAPMLRDSIGDGCYKTRRLNGAL